MAQESWNCDTAEGSGCQPQEGRVLCSNNCGFFGCAATMNLCSKCYRELTAKKQGSTPDLTKLSPASSTSPLPFSPVVTEKPFAKASFSLSLPAPIEQIMPQVAFTAAENVADEICSVLVTEPSFPSRPQSAVNRSLTAVPVPVATLLSSDSHGKAAQPPARRPSTNRCLTCKKRIGLLAFKCRCGSVFCAYHRYSDKHGCPFDYKSAAREAIAKANPVVIAKKVERI